MKRASSSITCLFALILNISSTLLEPPLEHVWWWFNKRDLRTSVRFHVAVCLINYRRFVRSLPVVQFPPKKADYKSSWSKACEWFVGKGPEELVCHGKFSWIEVKKVLPFLCLIRKVARKTLLEFMLAGDEKPWKFEHKTRSSCLFVQTQATFFEAAAQSHQPIIYHY